jgi:alpha-N-arabinofuranosidase
MYRDHMGSRLAKMNIQSQEPMVPSRAGSATMPGLSGSASIRDKQLTVTISNPSLDSSVTARLRLTNGAITEGKGSVLTHTEMTASNTLDHPNEVVLASFPVNIRSSQVEFSIPRHAVVSLELKMA